MMFSNFFKAATYGPGYVRLGWKPKNEEFLKKLQYCQVCKGFKAPRSHHCSQCNRCVMKMEHHCRKFYYYYVIFIVFNDFSLDK